MRPSIDEWPAAGQYHGAGVAPDARLGPDSPMARKLSFASSRRGGELLVRFLLLALAGALAGVLLGEESAEPLAAARIGDYPGSYAEYSANPEARVAQGETAAPCFACPDSYGVAARLRAERESRMASAFRELGAVDLDAPLPDEPARKPADDGYRYGGRFPDPASRIEAPTVEGLIPAEMEDEAQSTEPPGALNRE